MENQNGTPAETSFSDFKADPSVQKILNPGAPPAPAQAERVKPPETPSEDQTAETPEPQAGEAAANAGDAGESNQGKTKDKTAEGWIAHRKAQAELKVARQKQADLEKELQDLRTRKPEEKKPETEANAQPVNDGKPKLSDFENDAKYKTYGEALEAYNDARDEWREKKATERDQQSKADQTATERKQAHEVKLQAAREKYPDLDDKVKAAVEATGDLKNVGIEAALAESDKETFVELINHLASNVEDYRRIASMPPTAAYREMMRLEIKLSSNEETPEEMKRPVSKAPAPAERISGGGRGPDITADKARSMSEFKTNADVQKILARGR